MPYQTIPQTPYEVFEMLPEGTRVQLINDTIVMSPSPTTRHQRMLLFLGAEIYTYVRTNKIGHVFVAPLDVEFDKKNVFQPDIMFISNDNSKIIKDKRIYGAPDLIIEILSPGTRDYDEGEKLERYEQAGVKEYWIINFDDAFIHSKVYRREDLTYQKILKDGLIYFQTIELTLNLNDY